MEKIEKNILELSINTSLFKFHRPQGYPMSISTVDPNQDENKQS